MMRFSATLGLIIFVSFLIVFLSHSQPPSSSLPPPPVVAAKDFGYIEAVSGSTDSMPLSPSINQAIGFTAPQTIASFIEETSDPSKFIVSLAGDRTNVIVYIPVFTGPTVQVRVSAIVRISLSGSNPPVQASFGIGWSNTGLATINSFGEIIEPVSSARDVSLSFTGTISRSDVSGPLGSVLFVSYVRTTDVTPVFMEIFSFSLRIDEE